MIKKWITGICCLFLTGWLNAMDAEAPADSAAPSNQEINEAFSQHLNAPPLPVGNQETWLVKENQYNQLQVQLLNHVTGKHIDYSIRLPTRDSQLAPLDYALAENSSGLWLLGSTVGLLQWDGKTFRQNLLPELAECKPAFCYRKKKLLALGLDDGSLLAMIRPKEEDKYKVFRVFRQGNTLHTRQIANTPGFGDGISAVKLKDGCVLIAGGESGSTKTWLYLPDKDAWQANSDMRTGRRYPALAALPDGRAVVAGNSAIGSTVSQVDVAYGAEVWEPSTGKWTPLPRMPLSFNVSKTHATGPSATVLPDGSLVVAGGMHRQAILLRAEGKRFAPYWIASDPMPEQRISGVLQAVGNRQVRIMAGWQALSNGQCCKPASDSIPITWRNASANGGNLSVSFLRHDAAVSHQDSLSFVAGGWESTRRSSSAIQATAVAELLDHRNGQVSPLPPLPYPLTNGKARWLDDERILVKSVALGPVHGYNTPSLEIDAIGFLALHQRGNTSWRMLDDPRIADAELAGVAGKKAILASPDTRIWSVGLDDFAIRALPDSILQRSGGTSRVLPDGRIVLAGGYTQQNTIEAIDAACEKSDCPNRLFGIGDSLNAAKRYEIYNPVTGIWQLSAKSRQPGSSAVIQSDGRVAILTYTDPSECQKRHDCGWKVEESNANGRSWKLQPRLPEGESNDGSFCGNGTDERGCVLILAEHPGVPAGIVLLRRKHWVASINNYAYDLWLLDKSKERWLAAATNLTQEELEINRIALRKQGGKTLFGAHFQPDKVGVWLE